MCGGAVVVKAVIIRYLEKYNQRIRPLKTGAAYSRGLAFLVEKFDPAAELHRFEQAREHSVDLLKKWLNLCPNRDNRDI
jgi:hypothetical protein